MGLVFFSMCCLATKQENEICCEKKVHKVSIPREKRWTGNWMENREYIMDT